MGGAEAGALEDLSARELAGYAETLERQGDNLGAARLFEQAAADREEYNSVFWLNQAAINYRLAGSGHWTKALELFDHVIETTHSELRDRARRDKAMLLVDLGRFNEAIWLLQKAELGQVERGQIIESYVTQGFIGRVRLAAGERQWGREILERVNGNLRGYHSVYELNNLIWLLKAVSLPRRLTLLPRALHLAARTGYRRRGVEAMLITVSPTLYALIKSRRR